jgi:peptidoglycan hydrolase-like protein with peptidoglycan-binding domain
MLRTGSRGDEVADLQKTLIARGFKPGPVDGVFGPKTEAAVKAFQEEAGLEVDGIVGPKTEGALEAAAGKPRVEKPKPKAEKPAEAAPEPESDEPAKPPTAI